MYAAWDHGKLRACSSFSQCSRLFRLPFLPIFVFDGPEHPSMKRGKVINGNAHWLEASFQQMLDGFGFDWITAPGEAEATLSVMTNTGIPVRVDAILTDDSDSFVFGTAAVLRMWDNEKYEAALYSAHDVLEVLGLNREDFVLIAILAGGDYSDGLAKCGIKIAIGLVHASLGRQLIAGLSGKSPTESQLFLESWRDCLRSELRTNASNHVPHQCKQLALAIPLDFPDLTVINFYLHPVISEHAAPTDLGFQSPRLGVLASFAEEHFQWGDSIGILRHFTEQLFGGLVIRELTCCAFTSDHGANGLNSPSIIKSIVGSRNPKSMGHLSELRLMLCLDPIILTSALHSLIGSHDPEGGAQIAVTAWFSTVFPKIRVWAPKAMVEQVHPEMVLDYLCGQGMLVYCILYRHNLVF
ncbi:PIN domain-like protein [Mycena rosella]|uniref:PIN domain-like protein n=1 Tax=Mycena rosella TaxID=1033263 RepID=A0AAD7DI90_MYCRO|nr:PIN domain-like protein [Mycena rosella]